MIMSDFIKADVVIVGAGIVGLANAWAAAKRGRSVVVLERSPYAQGASIRNFGMVWPSGQPVGERFDIAMRSRSLWIEAAEQAGFWHHQKGSVYLATHEDELAVMHEFVDAIAETDGAPHRCRVLDANRVLATCPAAHRDHVIGGLFSETEVGVDPREAIRKLPKMLAERHGVRFYFDTHVTRCQPGVLQTSANVFFEAREHIVIASGAEINALYPEFFAEREVTPCKLQMLATPPQPTGWDPGPMIASGASMRHYEAFAQCPSLHAMCDRMDRDNPEWRRYGIHFMAAQNGIGEIVLGDSHEYGLDITPFNDERIDVILLDGLRRYLDLPDFSIQRRWNGTYLKSRNDWKLIETITPGVTAFNGLGGAGMTLSFGLADRFWDQRPQITIQSPGQQAASEGFGARA
jgi:FAD dependent oxidoreductase TIGR03364